LYVCTVPAADKPWTLTNPAQVNSYYDKSAYNLQRLWLQIVYGQQHKPVNGSAGFTATIYSIIQQTRWHFKVIFKHVKITTVKGKG